MPGSLGKHLESTRIGRGTLLLPGRVKQAHPASPCQVSSIQFGLKMGKIHLDGKLKLRITHAASFGIQGPDKEGRRGQGWSVGGTLQEK